MSDEIELSYSPLGEQEEFGAEEMFAQGAAALDIAAIYAIERRDSEMLVKIAREWTRMGSAISGIEPQEEPKKVIHKFGFGKENVEEEDNGESDRKSNDEDKPKTRGIRLRKY